VTQCLYGYDVFLKLNTKKGQSLIRLDSIFMTYEIHDTDIIWHYLPFPSDYKISISFGISKLQMIISGIKYAYSIKPDTKNQGNYEKE